MRSGHAGRLAPAVLALLAVSSAVVAIVPALGGTESTVATVEPVTPVFSVRRVPGVVTRTVAGGRLRAELDAILSDSELGDAPARTCLAVRDTDGRSLYDRQLELGLIPASTMKIVVAAVALAKMGPDFRYTTEIRAPAPPQDGAVADLWLVGSGDPLLATADFAAIAGWLETPRISTSIEALADRVVAAGVRRVTGRVMGDESRYDRQRYLPTWDPSYASNPEIGPQSGLNLNGGFVQWRPRAIAASSPATNAATVLTSLLRDRGVSVAGAPGEGTAPERSAPVASVESPPMSEVMGVVLRDSDNLAAELLVKELGVRFGAGGTTAAGVNVVRTEIAAMGLPPAQLAEVDGSGLDRGNRLTCGLLQALLAREGEGGVLGKGMPTAGTSGTLIRRFRNTPAAGKVRAKTGSLDEVVGLSGWATGLDGRSLQFSLVANELPYDAVGFGLQDQVASALATYPQAPKPDDIGPAPPRPHPA